jgi:hypothetical protein
MGALDDFGLIHIINNATKLCWIQVFFAKEIEIRRKDFLLKLLNFMQSLEGFPNIGRTILRSKRTTTKRLLSKCTNKKEKMGAKFSRSALSMFSVWLKRKKFGYILHLQREKIMIG